MRSRVEHIRTSEGTKLTVRVRGTGPALVMCNGWSTSEFFWKHMLPVWEQHYTTVCWDYPGHGESEPSRGPSDVQLELLADSVGRVMDAAGVGRGTLVGYSMGCQVVLEAAARMGDRIDAAIPLMGSFEHMVGTATHPVVGHLAAQVLPRLPAVASTVGHRALCRVMQSPLGIPLGRLLGMLGPEAAPVDVHDYIAHFMRADPTSMVALAVAAQRHSARRALAAIRAPVLIVAGEEDGLAPPRVAGELLHELLPTSRLVVLQAGTHTSLFEHHEEIAVLVNDFLFDVGVLRRVPSN
ncbi:MAG: alpha/beta hydrolase [Polyangiaceae bacterium]|nr:alpha/beta hydrolase [Polyangiaceae bacterium]